MFQSAPDPKAGREFPGPRRAGIPHEVSIRSRPEGRERGAGGSAANGGGGFNPLPTRRPGESGLARDDVMPALRFQSAPDPKAGRELGLRGLLLGLIEVSIRSRPEGRERVLPSCPYNRPLSCFNPLPTRRPGESHRRHDRFHRLDGFNPLPTRRPGESPRRATRWRSPTFQSAPDPKAGREPIGSELTGGVASFNPLPTRRPGERPSRHTRCGASQLFQSAPDPKAGRERAWSLAIRLPSLFQSAPDPKAGREHRLPLDGLDPGRFNPLPTRRPGERSAVTAPLVSVAVFQSAPDPKAGREIPRVLERIRQGCFNPLPTRRPGERTSPACTELDPANGFNPLPTRRPGERTSGTEQPLAVEHVSIRSRPEGRERGR